MSSPARALPPHGHVWNEELQGFIPLGQQLAIDNAKRADDPDVMLAEYDRRRNGLRKFIDHRLQQAEYDDTGIPLPGKLHDWYILPGWEKPALAKSGASKIADYLRLKENGRTKLESIVEAEQCSAMVSVELVDRDGRSAGAMIGAASTLEERFNLRSAREKYGAVWKGSGDEADETAPPDFRGAANDIVQLAGKRAFVGAVIISAALEDMFDIAASTESKPAAAVQAAPKKRRTRIPFGPRGNQAIANLSIADLEAQVKFFRKKRYAGIADELDVIIAERRAAEAAARDTSFDKMPAALTDTTDDLKLGGAE